MKIPATIQLAGLTIQVITAPTMLKDTGNGGHCDYPNLRIAIAGDMNEQMRLHTFWHEVMHFILFLMGEDKLRDDEKFVDLVSGFINQVSSGMDQQGE